MMESVAKTWFRRVWTENDVDAIDELFARDGKAYGIHGEVIAGPAEFRKFHAAFCGVFDGIRIDVDEEVVCGDRSAVRCTANMMHRATGTPVVMKGTAFLVLRDGQILEARNHWDFLGLLESMELMPERSFELAITGGLRSHAQAV